ncbi:2-methyl-6-phytyl-1,4-hydroquinone methyltransferase 1, chloroplastic-like isoform X2 [Phragmites australis]|uniref:2-methyl-6-phytyl-1,4-hydroquinone methyltransferase 1, chloroplastic-like isoform X2 n=1 Tax=Phragmites australis TaxID=29695 RepID=UPI002D767D25|nr:2-methyl-6-phytyl-1,4-hydroquinone methyltransferase 1, chloroplastic-like isoform X2 [Phragmites australis]
MNKVSFFERKTCLSPWRKLMGIDNTQNHQSPEGLVPPKPSAAARKAPLTQYIRKLAHMAAASSQVSVAWNCAGLGGCGDQGQELASFLTSQEHRDQEMASSSTFRAPIGLGFLGPSKVGLNPLRNSTGVRLSARYMTPKCVVSSSRPVSKPRFIQHKKEAFWFYRFLSIVYDHVINPGHWTEDMRDDALEPAELYDPELKVVDVGDGTGFATLGIVKHMDSQNVTLLDQSPHQLEKARQKEALKGVNILEGDAEDLPFPTDTFDRYVSAGSIEYWPDPQRGIKEAYRVLKPGGAACLIGPKEEEYMEWFQRAGFDDVKIKRIGTKWYCGVRRHGLIMGCSVTGVKTEPGDSPLQLGPKAEYVEKPVNPFTFAFRFAYN